MKIIKKELKLVIFMVLCSLMFLFSVNNNVLADSNIYGLEKSEEFQKWENLSEDERKNAIIPMFYNPDLKSSILRSQYNNVLGKYTSSMEARYDIRDELNLSVKNQKMTGSCWAFSFSSMTEAYALKNSIDTNKFSPMHIDYKTANMFKRNVGEGGNSFLAFAYALDKYGPTYENNFTFESVYDEEKNSQYSYYLTPVEEVDLTSETNINIKDTVDFPGIYKTYEDGQIKYNNGNN